MPFVIRHDDKAPVDGELIPIYIAGGPIAFSWPSWTTSLKDARQFDTRAQTVKFKKQYGLRRGYSYPVAKG